MPYICWCCIVAPLAVVVFDSVAILLWIHANTIFQFPRTQNEIKDKRNELKSVYPIICFTFWHLTVVCLGSTEYRVRQVLLCYDQSKATQHVIQSYYTAREMIQWYYTSCYIIQSYYTAREIIQWYYTSWYIIQSYYTPSK